MSVPSLPEILVIFHTVFFLVYLSHSLAPTSISRARSLSHSRWQAWGRAASCTSVLALILSLSQSRKFSCGGKNAGCCWRWLRCMSRDSSVGAVGMRCALSPGTGGTRAHLLRVGTKMVATSLSLRHGIFYLLLAALHSRDAWRASRQDSIETRGIQIIMPTQNICIHYVDTSHSRYTKSIWVFFRTAITLKLVSQTILKIIPNYFYYPAVFRNSF